MGPLALFLLVLSTALIVVGRICPAGWRSDYHRWAGLALMGAYTAVFGGVIVAETIVDPGGWMAMALISAWLGPLIVLWALAIWRPRVGATVLAVLTGLVVLLGLWAVADRSAWRSLEQRHGPVLDLATFTVIAGVAALGHRRPAVAGVMLILLGVVPGGLGFLLFGGPTRASLAVVSLPGLPAGLLLLLAARGVRPAANREGTGMPEAPSPPVSVG